MSGQLHGADLDELDRLSRGFNTSAGQLSRVLTSASGEIGASTRLWNGHDAEAFRRQWASLHRARLQAAISALRTAGETVARNRDQQELTSATGASAATALQLPGFAEDVVDFLFGDVANFWNGGDDDDFPIGQVLAALLKAPRVLRGELPLFNTGVVGRNLAQLLLRGPGPLPQAGAWLQTPGATNVFRTAGIVGGVASTGLGLYDLYQQGNPIDAFEREGAGYVADVAGTAFSASTTAFLVAPNPVTGALMIGTGAVWIGAEVVDNWDDISGFAGDTWDAGVDLVGDGFDAAGDVLDAGGDLLGGGLDLAGDIGGGIVSSVKDWF
ncbi:MAG: hypothetical protein AAF467_17670 [Actinomycetota bacterium]